MGTSTSPDGPVSVLQRLVGIKDAEPPISDEEYAVYQRFRAAIRHAPWHVADAIKYPSEVSRKTRAAVRRFVSDPALPGLIETLERAKVQSDADEKKRVEERQAADARAEERHLQRRLATIEAFHDNQLNVLRFRLSEVQHLIGGASISEAALRVAHEGQSEFTKGMRSLNITLSTQGGGQSAGIFGTLANLENSWRDKSRAAGVAGGMAGFSFQRTLVSMTEAERATLRMTEVLAAVGRISKDDHLRIAVPIVWNGGECAYDFPPSIAFRERTAMLEVIKQLLAGSLGTSSGGREYLNQAVRSALAPSTGLAEKQRELVERYLFSGNRWMTEAEGQRALARDGLSASALRIGGFPGGSQDLVYDLRESLITVAPSGAGKSQAHVLRNLLYLKAPALVLDVKGEMLAASRNWREREVGRTYVFAPREPEISFHFNPLDGVRTDPGNAWEDARTLADLLIRPKALDTEDEYFEGRARDMITTAVLDVALSREGDERTMKSVLELLYTSEDPDVIAWCGRLEELGSPQLALQAKALRGMPVKQRESIFDSARRHLEIWQSPNIMAITGDTTFDASLLRSECATVYIKVTLEDIKRFASVLRVLIGQSLFKLYRETPESDAQPITFFLDEMARLGRLDVIEQSLDVGRGYGVRLWLFCQYLSQLRSIYPNAHGMMSNCAIRCFMNPDEDAARWLTENLGVRHGLLDGTRKPLVEAHQLTGLEFADKVVAFSRGQPPARLDKRPAYADPECVARMKADGGKPSHPPANPSAAVQAATQESATELKEPPATDAHERRSDADVQSPHARGEPATVQAPAAAESVAEDGGYQASEVSEQRAGAVAQASAAEEQPAAAEPAGSPATEVVNWDTVRARAPAALTVAAPPERSGTWDWRMAAAGLAAFAAIGSLGWAVSKDSELRAAQAANAALVKERDEIWNARNAALNEKEAAARSLNTAVAAREAAQKAEEKTRADLKREGDAHAATRAELATARRDLDEARLTIRNMPPAQPQIPPQPQSQAVPAPVPPVQLATPTPQPVTPQMKTDPAGQSIVVTECDRLAANPTDARRASPGLGMRWPDLKRIATAASLACKEALDSYPKEQRLLYQLGRAIVAGGDDETPKELFEQLAKLGYPAACDNAATYYAKRGRWKEAESFYRQGVALGDVDSMIALADAIRGEKLTASRWGEADQLYDRAASLGHKGAQADVDQRRRAGSVIDQVGSYFWPNIPRR